MAGTDCTSELFVQAFEFVESTTRDLPLGQFDLLTLMAVWIFFSGEVGPRVQHAVMEVGMGGTFDPVNAVPHRLCVVTPIAKDHEAVLGPGLEKIAAAKLGVVPVHGVVVHAPMPDEARGAYDDARAIPGTRWVQPAPVSWRADAGAPGEPPKYRLKTQWGEAPLVLAGARGAENSALALTAFSELGFSPADALGTLAHVRWPGRMQLLHWPSSPCPVYVSGDHNEAGIRSLGDLLPAYPRKKLWILLGTTHEREAAALWSALLGAQHSLGEHSLWLTEPPFKPARLASIARFSEMEVGRDADPIKALNELSRRASREDLIVVTGSLYLIGEILKHAQDFST